MAIEDEGEVFQSAFLEDRRVPWKGLAFSVFIHAVLLPVLAIGLEQATRWPVQMEHMDDRPLVVQRIFLLKLPRNSQSRPEDKMKPLESKAKSLSAAESSDRKAPTEAKAAPAMAISSQQASRPQNLPVLILQPLIMQAEPTSLPDLAMPTITMVAPTPPKPRKVFDVGSIQKTRSMPKFIDPGPLPEPPSMMASTIVIRPKQLNDSVPKLPVYAAPTPMQTIQAPDQQAVSAGGPTVENPANLVLSSTKPIPARETITLPAAILPPKGGTGTALVGGQTQVPSTVDGGPRVSSGSSKSLEASIGAEKKIGMAGANGKTDSAKGTDTGKTDGNALTEVSAPIRIVHPVNGRHNVTIVQSGVDQILPLVRDLLKGDPVYTVYLKVGWSKEWVMHYCVPREGAPMPKQVGGVVSLSSPKEVLPPYPIITLAPLQRLIQQTEEVPKSATLKRAPMLFSGYLNVYGDLEGMKQEGKDDSGLGQMIVEALASWKMRPAMRSEAATKVQVILVVPMY